LVKKSAAADQMVNRRALLKLGLLSGAAVLADSAGIARALGSIPQSESAFAGGRQLGALPFINESSVPLDTAVGSELDGRLYTDLTTLGPRNLTTPTEKFYIRTRASRLLPDPASWTVKVDGLVEKPLTLGIEHLQRAAKPAGLHVMECAGNVPLTRFGLISACSWTGVPISELLDNAHPNSGATHVQISGFDRYTTTSATSIPGASWTFAREELNKARAFLATEMNGQPLRKDHGAPVRLIVPGWYGCACIKWVDRITLVDDTVEATSQMREFAVRTHQQGAPQLAREYQPAIIDQAAMAIRVEKWTVAGTIRYRVVGIAWGGSKPLAALWIRFSPDEDGVPVDHFKQRQNDPWTLWSHSWSPRAPGIYKIGLSVKDPAVRSRRLDLGYYVRTVEVTDE
jgi:DMSO/TMAO reductase YedYZ molybdopterin-dependent catalytic subunit